MPDWDFQPTDFLRMAFFHMRDNLETRKPGVISVPFVMDSWLPDSSFLL